MQMLPRDHPIEFERIRTVRVRVSDFILIISFYSNRHKIKMPIGRRETEFIQEVLKRKMLLDFVGKHFSSSESEKYEVK